MSSAQHIELQAIINHFNTLQTEQIEAAFSERWQPFILSLETEDDRVEAFQTFYAWQTKQMKTLAQHLTSLPVPSQKEGKKAAA